ncbi:Maf-like protein [Abyssalbus ytuae]|uniref:dTTP/UTP pyrophosphatase n=1 Tax=Abyssalbus ytuae TaxID=2926907 RepID=A0A9E6ZKB6_9FLAO|nr:Maf-like protein [Abyssalbus ytuae]UOB17249.1 Maf-like protein [Abyssalbus ytuae]
MINNKLNKYHIILASGSPRRQQFLKDLGINFEVKLSAVEETYPEDLVGTEISDYLAQVKALPFKNELHDNDILITSDTIVWHNNKALGKPVNEEDAFKMIKSLSDTCHEVITSVCFTTTKIQKTVSSITKVYFNHLTDDEIQYYIKNFHPLDKAGSYGIQEWIGYIGVEKIEGSHFNVMGLPTHLVYKTLLTIIE